MNAKIKLGCLQGQYEFWAVSPAPGEVGENKTMKTLCASFWDRLEEHCFTSLCETNPVLTVAIVIQNWVQEPAQAFKKFYC